MLNEEPGNIDVAGLFAAPERARSASATALRRTMAIQLQRFQRDNQLTKLTENLSKNSGLIQSHVPY